MTQSDFTLAHHISRRAANRVIRPFIKAYPMPADLVPHPQPLSLGGGLPNHGFFPLESVDLHLVDEPYFGEPGVTHSATIPREGPALDLKKGLQYEFPGDGHAELREFTRQLITKVHPPAYSEWDSILSNGSGNGLDKVADLLVNEGDVILVEEFTFPLTLQNIVERGGIPFPVKLNLDSEDGIDLEHLRDLLQHWEARNPGLARPKAIYTIPTGQNPTGLSHSLAFRQRLYDLCVEHDIIIIEDDPYGYLTLPPYTGGSSEVHQPALTPSEIANYLETSLMPSYLTLDTTGRVIRTDSFAKLYAPGLRLGFIIAHREFIQKLNDFSAVSTRGYSGVSQVVLLQSINHWAKAFNGNDVMGWLSWVMKVRAVYIHRRNVMLNALYHSEAFKQGRILPVEPKAGMFVIVRVNFRESAAGYHEDIARLMVEFVRHGILVVSGSDLCVDAEVSKDNANFLRLTLASANSDAEMEESIKRFSQAVVQYFATV